MDMLGLCHESERYGYLLVSGKMPSFAQIARILGDTEKEVFALIGELQAAGVFSQNSDGIIFSRRMVRDGERSDEGREFVKKRWEPNNKKEVEVNRSPNSPPNRSPNSHPIPENTADPTTLEARCQKDLKPTKGFKSSGADGRAGVRKAPAPPAAPEQNHTPDWADDHPIWREFKHGGKISVREWSLFFSPCRPNGSPTSIICPNRYTRDSLEQKYDLALEKLFGETVNFKLEDPKKEAAQ